MEKYSRILIYIFLLTILNLGISSYLIYKVNNVPQTKTIVNQPITTGKPSPTPQTKQQEATTDTQSDIKSDLIIIKAEIRALREALDVTGLLTATPKP